MSILSSSDIQADLHSTGARSVIFTFTERTFRGLEKPGFGTAYLLANGFDVVAVKTNRDLWYENLSDAQLTRLEEVGSRYSMRGGYGSSMGAYAAIRFSKALNLDRVLAISPLFDIKAEWDRRWASDAAAMGNDAMMGPQHIRDSADYFLIADPRCPDSAHVRRYREIIRRLHFLAAPYSGHPAGYFLNQVGALSPIVLSVFRSGCYPDMRRYKSQKQQSSVYLARLANACLHRRKLDAAQAVTLRALAIDPDNGEHHMQLAQILVARQAVPAAIESCNRAIALNPEKAHFRTYLKALHNLN